MEKLLILPSWYPSPEDKLNGSFFQEQARLVNHKFDIKVLRIRFRDRPPTRTLLKTPIRAGLDWLRFLFSEKRTRTQLPDDEVFLNPPLIEYGIRVTGSTQRKRYQEQLKAYLWAIEELMASGWIPDLIHAHSVNFAGLVAKRIKEVYGIPYVITEHMPFALCNYPKHIHEDIKRSFGLADITLLLGDDQIRQLGMVGIDVPRNLVYSFVDENLFNKVCHPYHPGLLLKLVSIGAASHYKDYLTLLRALAVLKDRGIPFEMTLIGLSLWGNRYDEIREFITQNGLADQVKIIARLGRHEVNEYLQKSHVYLMTSIIETFCVSMMEAMTSGLPVVTTSHGGGAVDLMTNDTGVVVPVKDHEAVADRLEDMYRGNLRFDPKTIRQYAVSVCGVEAFRHRLTGYYERAMGKEALIDG